MTEARKPYEAPAVASSTDLGELEGEVYARRGVWHVVLRAPAWDLVLPLRGLCGLMLLEPERFALAGSPELEQAPHCLECRNAQRAGSAMRLGREVRRRALGLSQLEARHWTGQMVLANLDWYL